MKIGAISEDQNGRETFISAQQLLEDSFALGLDILDSGFRPDFIVGVWRGGTPVGIAVQELLDYFGVDTDHISIRTSSHQGIGERSERIRVHGLGYIVKNVNANNALLIVDDVRDTGLRRSSRAAFAGRVAAKYTGRHPHCYGLLQTSKQSNGLKARLLRSRNRSVAGLPSRVGRIECRRDYQGQGGYRLSAGRTHSGSVRARRRPSRNPRKLSVSLTADGVADDNFDSFLEEG